MPEPVDEVGAPEALRQLAQGQRPAPPADLPARQPARCHGARSTTARIGSSLTSFLERARPRRSSDRLRALRHVGARLDRDQLRARLEVDRLAGSVGSMWPSCALQRGHEVARRSSARAARSRSAPASAGPRGRTERLQHRASIDASRSAGSGQPAEDRDDVAQPGRPVAAVEQLRRDAADLQQLLRRVEEPVLRRRSPGWRGTICSPRRSALEAIGVDPVDDRVDDLVDLLSAARLFMPSVALPPCSRLVMIRFKQSRSSLLRRTCARVDGDPVDRDAAAPRDEPSRRTKRRGRCPSLPTCASCPPRRPPRRSLAGGRASSSPVSDATAVRPA